MLFPLSLSLRILPSVCVSPPLSLHLIPHLSQLNRAILITKRTSLYCGWMSVSHHGSAHLEHLPECVCVCVCVFVHEHVILLILFTCMCVYSVHIMDGMFFLLCAARGLFSSAVCVCVCAAQVQVCVDCKGTMRIVCVFGVCECFFPTNAPLARKTSNQVHWLFFSANHSCNFRVT